MKVKQLIEGTITDFQQFRNKKSQEIADEKNRKIEALKSEQFNQIDLAVAATIDSLIRKGVSWEEASDLVYGHLSDLVDGYELEKE